MTIVGKDHIAKRARKNPRARVKKDVPKYEFVLSKVTWALLGIKPALKVAWQEVKEFWELMKPAPRPSRHWHQKSLSEKLYSASIIKEK